MQAKPITFPPCALKFTDLFFPVTEKNRPPGRNIPWLWDDWEPVSFFSMFSATVFDAGLECLLQFILFRRVKRWKIFWIIVGSFTGNSPFAI